MPMNERTLNGFIAAAMSRQAPPNYRFTAEQSGTARSGGATPDIVVEMPYGLRTIIETEYGAPAVKDAIARLGYQFNDYNIPMKSVIALGIPRALGELELDELASREPDAPLMSHQPQFLMQVVTGKSPDDQDKTTVPAKPFPVSLQDVVQYAWLAAIPAPYAESVMQAAISDMTKAKNALSDKLNDRPAREQARLTRKYGKHDSANKMESVAGNIVGTLFSMIQLHANLKKWGSASESSADELDSVLAIDAPDLDSVLAIDAPELYQRIAPHDGIPAAFAAEWRKIQHINYEPLSKIAADMLQDSDVSPRIGDTLRVVKDAVANYIDTGISATTNIAAEIWQSLIPDRDQRAAYYTKPATAELLANITTRRLAHPRSAKYNEVCAGTGTLARATEENIRFRHYAQSNDKRSIHADRMQSFIQLTDINPQSISVATANMTSLEPGTPFKSSAVFAITADGGALNFLTPTGVSNMQASIIGLSGAQNTMLTIDPRIFDICNNNDPYFRPRGGAHSPIDRKSMQKYKREADRRLPGVANGQSGLHTFMQVIEHIVLGYGRPHGKVLPLSVARTVSNLGFRRNFENEYCDVIAISTASGEGDSMSADTGIQEMLLIGTKHTPAPMRDQTGDRSVTCVNLTESFTTKLEAKMFADAIRREVALGKKSGKIAVGIPIGTYYRLNNLGDGAPWSVLGASGDFAVLTALLTQGSAYNPATGEITDFDLRMTTMDKIATRGTGDDLIGKIAGSRSPRGAFVIHKDANAKYRNNPSMWAVDEDSQLAITCEPTHYGEPRGDVDAVKRILNTAGHFHLSRNLRQSAQKIAVCYTPTVSIGGRAWTTIDAEPDVIKAITLFLNSTYGLIVRTGYGEATDLGRSTMGVKAIDDHPIPDFAADTDAAKTARRIAAANFDRLRTLPLKRISLSALDPNRAEIDRTVTQMLGLPHDANAESMLTAWRKLMCLQPIVNANNKSVLRELERAGVRG